MSTLPLITGPDRDKPLCYDPGRSVFIYYDDLISGKEKVIPLDVLSHDQLKMLIIERNKVGPDYKVATLTGQFYSRDDVVKAIAAQTDFGRMTVQAEASMLSNLLKQIEAALNDES
jgi:hypothetical protein